MLPPPRGLSFLLVSNHSLLKTNYHPPRQALCQMRTMMPPPPPPRGHLFFLNTHIISPPKIYYPLHQGLFRVRTTLPPEHWHLLIFNPTKNKQHYIQLPPPFTHPHHLQVQIFNLPSNLIGDTIYSGGF